ncbi:MFS transporter [Sodalis sp. RH22]|uniref:MFS transporter n=1 Tax=unclassified Sodalis (in: enterobacteria) TaxID=2636512 RepID=UPI0039B38761
MANNLNKKKFMKFSTLGLKLPIESSLIVHTVTLTAYLAASTAPTPLYRLYQAQWHFSSVMLTLIFGIYALALLSALLVAGSISDYIGRRPIISIALALELAAMGLFLTAGGPSWLITARALQGVATGLATAALGAALIDLDRERGALTNGLSTMGGMAIGALGTTALVQLAPAPLHLVFILLLLFFFVQLLQTWRTPETSESRPGVLGSLRPSVAIPKRARATLLAITPINVAVWALGGFYLSLMPSLIAMTTKSTSVWLGGLNVATLTLCGGLAIFLVRRSNAFWALVIGAVMLMIGMSIILAGANLGLTVVLLTGSAIAGVGFGSGFLGAIRSIVPLAEPTERAGLMAAFYVESYLANSIPAILAGYMAQHLDLLSVANLYGSSLILLSFIGFVLALFRARGTHRRASTIA